MSTETPSSSAISDNATIVAPVANREDMIQTARQFLQNPRVRTTPIEDQKKFLREKGLTNAEIEQAIKLLEPPQQQYEGPLSSSSQPNGDRFLSTVQSAVILGGASYMAYKFVRSWLLPKFFNIPDPAQEQVEELQSQLNDLQSSTKFMMDSVVQTLETVSAQQEQLNRALMLLSSNGGSTKGHDFERLHADIAIVKSLLLNQKSFPPIPEYGNSRNCNGVNPSSTSYTNGQSIQKLNTSSEEDSL